MSKRISSEHVHWWDNHHGQGEVERVYAKRPHVHGMGKRRKTHLTQRIVRELLDYNPKTGVLIWKPRSIEWFYSYRRYCSWNAKFAGRQALTTKRTDRTRLWGASDHLRARGRLSRSHQAECPFRRHGPAHACDQGMIALH
jgi:hypothetical protein